MELRYWWEHGNLENKNIIVEWQAFVDRQTQKKKENSQQFHSCETLTLVTLLLSEVKAIEECVNEMIHQKFLRFNWKHMMVQAWKKKNRFQTKCHIFDTLRDPIQSLTIKYLTILTMKRFIQVKKIKF